MGLMAEYVERSGILIRAKQPYYDWINKLDPEEPLNLKDHPIKNVYLIDSIEEEEEPEAIIERFYEVIFAEELFGLWTDENDWPQDRSVKLFNEWYDWEIIDMAFDIFDEDELDESEEW